MPRAKTTGHETPPGLFDQLDAEFGPFTCDPACRTFQYTAQRVLQRGGLIYCDPGGLRATLTPDPCDGGLRGGYDGLIGGAWGGRVWLNPPYGREMPRWIEKAVAEVEAGHCERVVALIPSRTDTKMWQRFVLRELRPMRNVNYCVDAHAAVAVVRFLPGRVKFVGTDGPAPFPSAVVVWSMEER